MHVLALCFGAVVIAKAVADSSNQFAQVLSFFNCPDHPDLPNMFNETGSRRDYTTEDFFVSGVLQLTQPIENGTKLYVTISKCVDGENSDSCKPRLEVIELDFCRHMGDEDKVWSPVFKKIKDFYPDCPVPAGNYLLDDGLISMSELETLKTSNGIYEIKLLFTYMDQPQLCVISKGNLRTVRRKRKPARKPTNVENAFRRSLT